MVERFDVAVIGGGPGGYVAGIRLAQQGKKTVVIEKENLGGVCLNWGCIPSKAIIHAANVRSEVDRFGKVFSSIPEVDAEELQSWKNEIVKRQRYGIANLLKSNKCTYKKGTAKLTAKDALEIDAGGETETINFENLIIATGAKVIELPFLPFSEEIIGNAKDAVHYDSIPKELVVIGGGVIGCELGMAYAKLGSKVTIVEMLDTIMPGTDKDLLRPLLKAFKALKVELLTGAQAKSFTKTETGGTIEVTIKEETKTLNADRVLVSVGFQPNTKELGLEAAGVELDDKGWLPVSAECRTNVENIYAIGDVTGPPLLAHRASFMGEVAADVICGKAAAFDVMAMPTGAFTDPEIATAGLSEEEAEKRGYEVRVGLFPVAALGRAATMNATEGVVKLISDGRNDVLLGVGIVAANACDLIGEVCLALEMGTLAEDIALTVHVHPTLSEGIMEAAKAARGEAVHILNRPRRRPKQSKRSAQQP